MTPNKKDKTQKILGDYTKSAEFYNSRYESIQFVKFSLLLPKLISNRGKFLFREYIDSKLVNSKIILLPLTTLRSPK